ncbi:MAG TPA: VIT and VWA domain-containing protein, partial [Pyrinomonadaceae bacterium]|nr:VIT and VWA domain-containing protein [Pyrinomonadaceae bacterium]
MSRRLLLNLLSIIFVLMFSGLLINASAQEKKQPTPNAGSLQAFENGKPAGQCPLKHTSVKAEVSGFLSRVTVTQDFENPFSDKIEAFYSFPLPQAAAVDDMTMLIGDRTVKGKIMRREDAHNAYAAAKQLGKVAALLDQERPNIFTQSVANILPGQQIRIVISYVETLKYEDGSYEWSFPMVVGPRYNPVGTTDPTDKSNRLSTTPPIEGMRAGHDISLELSLNAGVPIESLNSKTHETEIDRTDPTRALIRLKDLNTIPNKDFVLTYQVAGSAINDAVLTHRSERGGYFTLILQPPQRVSAEDVTPKELVFVLDTSGSMSGFPIETAKKTMKLALDKLYPHDTFNLITFAGDTRVLFSEPVAATPENLRKAKKFLNEHEGSGGTEMMKAIKAALKPSDSQQHVRIVCFMTDGYVGNDMAIIAEVQKYSNARVFSMGIGSSPNRFLLDNMAKYGRGEVDYVLENSDASVVANRFHERVRNPLLTDISIDWSTLPVADVYPQRIPDLFSVKPVILSGRYLQGATGKIVLKGKLAGQDFVREIPVELPETENSHDVLATLWARRKIDELMGQDMAGAQSGNMKEEPREEITELGLKFKLMTQFTSFVAIDEVIFTGADPARPADVPLHVPAGTVNAGVAGLVTVTAQGGGSGLNTTDMSIGRSVTSASISNLPLQGRSVMSLVELTPGTVVRSQQSEVNSSVDLSTNGQRPNANMFMLDGVSANFGIAPGGQNPGPSAAGSTPALTASGGANGLVALDATQEMNIRTSYTEPQYGRMPGAQVNVITHEGTNDFHGSLFHFFGNDALDANDWFANNRGLKQPARRLNNFGGALGGPIVKDRTFFFASYEGLRLRRPMTGIT